MEAWEQFDEVDASTHASSIAYYSFLSLVPLLALFCFGCIWCSSS